MSLLKKKEFERRLAETEALIGRLDALVDGEAKRSAVEAIQALLSLHGEGLARLLQRLGDLGQHGSIEEAARDEVVAGLLILHGLHPLSMEDRVRRALDRVRPYLGSHGGNVELLGVDDGGQVRLRLEGSCHGCPSSALTLKHAIEREILEAAPEVTGIEVVDPRPAAPAGFVPLSRISQASISTGQRPGGQREEVGWATVDGLATAEPSGTQVRSVSGQELLLCRPGEAWYAYRDRCPGCRRSLEGARLLGTVLGCPGCGRRFDVRLAGRGVDGEGLQLEPVPLLVEDGRIRVALPLSPSSLPLGSAS